MANPIPTITWNARWTTSDVRTVLAAAPTSRPLHHRVRVPVASHDSPFGMRIPRMVSSRAVSGMPPIVSGAPAVVCHSASIAASFAG